MINLDIDYKTKFANHPFWQDYQELCKRIVDLRPSTIEGDPVKNKQLDLLERRQSDLAEIMGIDLGLVDPQRDDPLWQRYSSLCRDLQDAKYDDAGLEEHIFDKLHLLLEQINAKYGPKDNQPI